MVLTSSYRFIDATCEGGAAVPTPATLLQQTLTLSKR